MQRCATILNGATIGLREWISNFFAHLTCDVDTDPYWHYDYTTNSKMGPSLVTLCVSNEDMDFKLHYLLYPRLSSVKWFVSAGQSGYFNPSYGTQQ